MSNHIPTASRQTPEAGALEVSELPRTLMVHQTNVAIKALLWREAKIAADRAVAVRKAADFLGEGTEEQNERWCKADTRVFVSEKMVEDSEQRFWTAVDEMAAALPETIR